MKNTLSFVYVNYFSIDKINQSLLSFLKYSKKLEYEIIIVDNSFDSSEEEVINLPGHKLKYLKQSSNLGFAKANNIAVSHTSSKYICFINPDTLFIEDCITPILGFMELNQYSGVCAPGLKFGNLTYQNSSGYKLGLTNDILEALMIIGILRKFREMNFRRKYSMTSPVEVDWLSGAFMIIKRDVFDKVNGFNEKYFLNYEDIDFCKKVQDAGYKNYYFPGYQCIHYDHGSFKRDYETLVLTRYQSRLIYSKFHYSGIQAFLARVIHIVGILLRIIGIALFYRGKEKLERRRGYLKSLNLYFRKNYN